MWFHGFLVVAFVVCDARLIFGHRTSRSAAARQQTLQVRHRYYNNTPSPPMLVTQPHETVNTNGGCHETVIKLQYVVHHGCLGCGGAQRKDS
jgi:hypothetical protein